MKLRSGIKANFANTTSLRQIFFPEINFSRAFSDNLRMERARGLELPHLVFMCRT